VTLELLTSAVFRNAMLAGTIAAALAGLIGYFVVLRSQAFAAEAFLDICFAGATGAALLGFAPVAGMAVFGLGSALGIGALGQRARERSIEIGMVLSFALGMGVLFLSLYAHGSAAHSNAGMAILFGYLLSVRPLDLYRMLAIAAVALSALAVVYRPLLYATVDEQSASAKGVRVRLLSAVFLLILALAAAASSLVVGVLLASALLIAPPAAAVRLTRRPARALALSLGIALGVTWGGILYSFAGPGRHPPVGFSVSALAALVYFASAFRRRKGYARGGKPIIISDSAETGQWISRRGYIRRSERSGSAPRSPERPSPRA
jgi:zinc/manganese transport system permease protein